MNRTVNFRPLIAAGTLLGIGMGGFVDGIVFHQILQLHSMLSARRPRTSVVNLEVNMFWDGVFHAFTWLMTAAGVAMLFRAGRRADVPWSGRTLIGAMLAGWGTFNLVEGVIDHHVLHVHHVVESLGGVSKWDWAFLASQFSGGPVMAELEKRLPAFFRVRQLSLFTDAIASRLVRDALSKTCGEFNHTFAFPEVAIYPMPLAQSFKSEFQRGARQHGGLVKRNFIACRARYPASPRRSCAADLF